jgi:hypothetical protein
MYCRAAITVVCFAALAAPAPAQVTLQWKFKEGEKFYLEERMDSVTKTVVLGMNNTETHTQQRISSFVVKSASPDGFVLEQRVDSWQIKATGSVPEDAAKLLEQAFKDVPFTVTISKSGKITKFEGYDQVLKRMAKLNPGEYEQFKAFATEDAIRSLVSMAFELLPEKPTKKGETWKKMTEVPLGGVGKFTIQTELTLDGTKVDGGELITTKGTFSFSPGKGNLSEGVKLLDLKLTKSQQIGKVIFDPARGRLVVREIDMDLAGTMTLDSMGQQIDVQLEGTEKRTIRLHDKKPAPGV